MHALSRAKNLINEYNARIVADPIYNRRKNNKESVITLSFIINQFLIINSVFITQASKKRDKLIKIIIILKQASQASITY